MVLEKKKTTNIPMEKNWDPRNKPKHIQSSNIWWVSQGYLMEREILFNKWYWRNLICTWIRIKVNLYLTLLKKLTPNGLKTEL